jgi:hypothetical protein
MSENKELSRSELVRLRREKENAQRMQRIVNEATRPLPPVTTRARQNASAPKAKVSKTRQNARRRFQIALPRLPRTSLRSISIPRPRLGWRFFSFILSAVVGLALYFAFHLPQLRVAEAQVIGNQIITSADVNSVLNISGQPIFTVIPADLETRLRLNFPELVSVQVAVALPNLVTVNMSERKPVVRWEQGGGYTWVAEDGVAFKPRGEKPELISVVAESAPPVTGTAADPLNPAPFISTDMVLALKGLAGHVPPGVPILYEARMGFGWNDPRGWRVYFGATSNDVELKMRVYESLVDSLTQRGIRPALINVTFPTAPYYRMSQ